MRALSKGARAVVACALLLAACDGGPYHDEATVTGPPINLVASGTNIAAGDTYTIDQPITLAFDRFLQPESVIRQSIYLEDSSGDIATNPLIAYDPVTLTVTLSPAPGQLWLTVGQEYRVVLNVADPAAGDAYGLLAIDGATLAAPVTLIFTANAAATPPAASAPTIDFCDDIYKPIFLASCAFASCHAPSSTGNIYGDGGLAPVLGLDLSTPQAIVATAIGQVADESNTGPLATVQSATTQGAFGVDMAIVAPGDPGESFLLYKTLLGLPPAASTETVGGDSGIDPYGQTLPSAISNAERTRLGDSIEGQSMPYPNHPQTGLNAGALTQGDLVRLSLWIAQGANVTSCK